MKQKIIPIDPLNPDPLLISKAAKIIKNGGVVAFPTDTCYGLAVNPFDPQALDRLFEIKGRKSGKAIILLVSDMDMLGNLIIRVSPLQKSFMEAFWPGPLTLILNKKPRVPEQLGGKQQTIGIRYPKAEIPLRLIEKVGLPITATSANQSGKPTAQSAQEIEENIGANIELILDAGHCGQTASTILDLTVTPPKILRKGQIPEYLIDRLV